MRLINAVLDNYCQHRKLEAEFASGLTGIVGRNGTGKSNLIKGIYAAITGDFSRNSGIKVDNICQVSTPVEEASVYVRLEHNNSIFDIQRGLRPDSHKLTITTGELVQTFSKATEVNEALVSSLGVPFKMLADYVFVDQWTIFDVLALRAADRVKAMQRLFKLDKAEQIFKAVGDHHSTISIPIINIDQDSVKLRIKETSQKLIKIKEEIHNIGDADARMAEFHDKLDILRKKVALTKAINETKQRKTSLEKSLETLNFKIDKLDAEILIQQKFIDANSNKYESAKQMLSSWGTYEELSNKQKQQDDKIKELTHQLNAIVTPDKPYNYILLKEEYTSKFTIYEQAALLDGEVASLLHLLDISTNDEHACPLCASKVDMRSKLKELRIRLDEAKEARDILNHNINISNGYRVLIKQVTQKRAELQQLIDQLSSNSFQLETIQKPVVSKKELETLIKDVDSANTLIRVTKHNATTIIADRNIKHAQLISLIESIDRSNADLTALPLITEELQDIQRSFNIAELADKKKTELQIRTEILSRSLVDDEKALEDAKQTLVRADMFKKWSTYELNLQNLFHRDNLPKLIAQSRLDSMQADINALLDRFESPFTVESAEDLTFIAHFADGRHIPATRLSGGQKVLLALAFRVVVNSTFASDLGLLCLDEPTAGLDEANLSCIKVALERLRELSQTRGLQVVMITHEKNLPCFDRVIDLG